MQDKACRSQNFALYRMSSKTKRRHRKENHDAHVRTYKKEIRRLKNKECRNYTEYERKRKNEGKTKLVRISKLKKLILATYPEISKPELAMFLCILDMVFRDYSLRIHVAYMHEHSGSVNTYGLKYSLKIRTARFHKTPL